MRCFIDSNVLVYLRDPRDLAKTERATAWMRFAATRDAIVISPQVINEFTSVLTRKLKLYTIEEVEPMAVELRRWCSASSTIDTSLLAFEVHRRFRFAWWDSLIVASALQADCDLLLSEDMSHRQRVGPLRILNPFLVRPDEALSPN